ncbi:hypothetical protein V6N13_139581 [Hibiscus sabdariffa]
MGSGEEQCPADVSRSAEKHHRTLQNRHAEGHHAKKETGSIKTCKQFNDQLGELIASLIAYDFGSFTGNTNTNANANANA